VFFVDTIEVPGLDNRGYLVGGERTAVAVDPPRDVDQVIAAAARHGVRISHMAETHVHNDYVTGGPELARIAGAAYLVPAGARVSFERTPVRDGDVTALDTGLALRALTTPGHTPHHTSYVLEANGTAVAVFTGGSLLTGTVGRPDLVEPRLTERLARAQHASAQRPAAGLPDDTAVLPTHGFGSFCSSARAEGRDTTIGKEKVSNEALTRDVDTFGADLLAGLDDVPAYYAHMGPANAAGPDPVDLTPPAVADADEIAGRLDSGEWVVDLRNRVAFAAGHVWRVLQLRGGGAARHVSGLADPVGQAGHAARRVARAACRRPAGAGPGGHRPPGRRGHGRPGRLGA
jgi:hydroxyacylglutathione hydrolase